MRALVVLAAVVAALSHAGAEPLTLPLWPDGSVSPLPPASEATRKLIASYGGATKTRVTDVTDPTITVFSPDTPSGTTVIVAPGGGYMFLSYAHEGTQVCEWLNSIGITAVLLKYRTPTRDADEPFALPVQDARRALHLVRQHAADWNIDAKRVGLLGFSAGANLAGHAAWDPSIKSGADVQALSGRPDFVIFIYGGGFLGPTDKSKFRNGFRVPPDAPPAFFLVAHDDKNNPEEAAMLYLEYKKQGLPAELHIFTKGGHGFGMRKDKNPINNWPQLCADWMRSIGLVQAP